MRRAVIEALDHAYRFDGDDASWLTRLTEALVPVLDTGHGVHAFLVDVRDPNAFRLHTPISVGLDRRWESRWYEDWWQAFMLTMPPQAISEMLGHSACNYSHELWAAMAKIVSEFGPHLEQHRAPPDGAPAPQTMQYPDSLNLVAVDASGLGCALAANRHEVVQGTLPKASARTLSMLAMHIAAAYRLRLRHRERDPLASGEAEVILDERRRVLHAEGPAKSESSLAAIRESAVAVARARPDPDGRAPQDPERAIAAWNALTSGRWSVLDHFDRDGRRYFIARANAPEVAECAELSEREVQVVRAIGLGHSNKLIAYELGLHPSTVSSHIASASRKLGVTTRLELVRHGRLFGERGAERG